MKVRQADAIARVIEDLGFRASASARSLRKGTTQAIGMIVPDIENPYYAATVAGAESVGRQNGLRLFLCNTDEDLELEREVLEDVIRRVDGVILVPASEASSTEPFEGPNSIPLVLMDRETSSAAGFDTVLIDNYRGGAAAAEHLLELGHRDVALISGPLTASQSRSREQGFVETFARAGAMIDESRIERGNFREDGGYQGAFSLLTAHDRPTALFVVNNMMSIGAIRAIRDLHLRFPEDLSLVCFDSLPQHSLITPRVTTIARPMHEQGAMAMRLILKRLSSSQSERPGRTLVMPVELTIGASTRPV